MLTYSDVYNVLLSTRQYHLTTMQQCCYSYEQPSVWGQATAVLCLCLTRL